MSAGPEPPTTAEPGGDPSMEDILASIRRILNEEEPHAGAGAGREVFELTQAMRVDAVPEPPPAPRTEPIHAAPMSAPEPAAEPATVAEPAAAEPPKAVLAERQPAELPHAEPEPAEPAPKAEASTLVAPAAAAAAAASMSELVRRLADSQNIAIHRGGPTLEDMVREEIRGLLKAWLDENLPRVVERLVRAEIERVVGRHVG